MYIAMYVYLCFSVTQGVRLAAMFEELIKDDDRFEIPAKRILGMVVFRLNVSDLAQRFAIDRFEQ